MAASAASLTAQPADRPGRGERPEREVLRKQALELFDKNKDGELDEKEREAARESFRRNGPPDLRGRPAAGPPADGGRGGRRGRGGSRRGQRVELIPKFDKDEDGILDKAERSAAREFVLKQRESGGGERGSRGGAACRPRQSWE